LISNHFGDSIGGPEKAGVGGSIPSLATNNFNNLATGKKRVRISSAHNARTSVNRKTKYASPIGSNHFQISRATRLLLFQQFYFLGNYERAKICSCCLLEPAVKYEGFLEANYFAK
jgi:hypothetical protein